MAYINARQDSTGTLSSPVELKRTSDDGSSIIYTRTNIDERQNRDRLRQSRFKDGFRPPTPYARTIIQSTPMGGKVVDTLSTGRTYTWTGSDNTSRNFVPYLNTVQYGILNNQPLIRNAINRSQTEALVKIGRSQANFGESIGEIRSTLFFMLQTVSGVSKALLAIRKGNIPLALKELGLPKNFKFSKAARSASQKWLELQFAWKPLLQDIYDLKKILDTDLLARPQLFSVVREVKTSLPLSLLSGEFNSGSIDFVCKTKLYGKVSNPQLHRIVSLGLINPLEIAWAVMPFSFVFDWFAPVQTVLSAFTSTAGVDFVSGTQSLKLEFDLLERNRPPNSTARSREGYLLTRHVGVAMSRFVLNSWPTPVPYIKNPFSSSHLISTLALITSLRRS